MSGNITVKLTLLELSSGIVVARIDQSPTGASKWPGNEFEWPNTQGNWFCSFMDRWLQPGSEKNLNPQEFGKGLYDLILDGNIRAKLTSAIDEGRERGDDICLVLNLCGRKLSRVPFELL